MQMFQNLINWILGFGASVFVPIIMIIAGLIVKMKPKDAISAGLLLGIAFTGMSEVINFMRGAITPVAEAMIKATGVQLSIMDGGWTTMSVISWAWPYAFAMFPLQIGINILLLALGKTKTFNADLWNVWGKIFTAVIVMGTTNSVVLAFVVASLQIVLELWSSDAHQKRLQKMSGIPGVTCSHRTLFFSCILWPFDMILRKIPFLNKEFGVAQLRDKIGIFAENHVLGFILGCVFGIIGRYDIVNILKLGLVAGTAMTLFPMVTKLFMQALAPISEAVQAYMQKRFKDRELYVGLDWPYLGGANEIWIAVIAIVPMLVIYSFILPGNNLLPFAGVINLLLAVPAWIVTKGNVPRMLILCAIGAPVFLYVGTAIAPYMSQLAMQTGAVELAAGELISNSSINAPVFTYATQLFAFLQGNFLPLIVAVVWGTCWVLYTRWLKKEDALMEQEEQAQASSEIQ